MATRARDAAHGTTRDCPLWERLEALASFQPIFGQEGLRFAETVPSRVEDGLIVLGGTVLGDAALEFVRVAEEYGWVRPFDWPAWRATEAGQRMMHDPGALAHASVDDLAKVITTCIRAERFRDGYLADAFDAGLLGRVVARAARLVQECALWGA